MSQRLILFEPFTQLRAADGGSPWGRGSGPAQGFVMLQKGDASLPMQIHCLFADLIKPLGRRWKTGALEFVNWVAILKCGICFAFLPSDPAFGFPACFNATERQSAVG